MTGHSRGGKDGRADRSMSDDHAEAAEQQEGGCRLERVPLGVILRNSLDRPWLALYRERPSEADADGAAAEHALVPGEEVWLKIASLVGWLDLGRLGAVCTMMQRIAANESLWEPKCLRAWRLRGFVPCAEVLYAYNWSWKRMVRAGASSRAARPCLPVRVRPLAISHRYATRHPPTRHSPPQFLSRPRLRTDGIYYLEVQTFTSGMNEGRGMKELGRDFYRGKLVQSRYWRYLRFLPDGRLLTLTTWRPPMVAATLFAKASHARTGSEPALRRLGATLFGQYEIISDDAKALVRLRASALVALEQYPRMRPSTVHFEFALGTSGKGANNAHLCILSHYSSYEQDGSDVLEHAVPAPGRFSFCSFDAARRAVASGVPGALDPPPMPPLGSVSDSRVAASATIALRQQPLAATAIPVPAGTAVA